MITTGAAPSAASASDPKVTSDGPPASRYAPKQWIYRNLTPYRIEASYDSEGKLLTCRDGQHRSPDQVAKVLSISALGEAVLPHEDANDLRTLTMRRLGQLELRPAPSCLRTNLPRAIIIYGWLAVALVVTMWALLFGGGSAVPWRWCIAIAVAVPVVALLAGTWRELLLYSRFGKYRSEDRATSLEGVQRGGRIQSFVVGAPRQVAEIAVLSGVLAVSVVGLGVAIHLTTQLNDLMPIDYRALLQLDDPFTGVDAVVRSSPAFWQLLVGHIAQWVLVSVAALVPAAMYFQFDRQRLSAVQRQWIRDVFRLDPTVRTVRDIEAKYGSQIEASFGDIDPDSGLRLGRGRRSPIIVATVLLVVGWFLVISTTQVPRLQEVSGGEWQWPNDQPFPVSTFFWPHLTLLGYAFLGAYVFSVLHVIRGYQRRDLHPKTYNTIVVRILTAYALALVVSVVYDGAFAEVVMFFVGFMPQSALVWLREKVSSRSVKQIPLHEHSPLTELEGIDLYDRTRLAEEGINNVEALAHADIINLMSSTRIPAAELVDWTDQALLYLKVGGDAMSHVTSSMDQHQDVTQDQDAGAATGGTGQGTDTTVGIPQLTVEAKEHVPDVRLNLCHLRCFGIRTASDLMQAYGAAVLRGHGDPAATQAEVDALRTTLALPSGPQKAQVPPIQVIIDTLPDEEWFVQVHNWRNSEFGTADAWYRYLDGLDWTLQQLNHPTPVDGPSDELLPIKVVGDPCPSSAASAPAPPLENTNGTGDTKVTPAPNVAATATATAPDDAPVTPEPLAEIIALEIDAGAGTTPKHALTAVADGDGDNNDSRQ